MHMSLGALWRYCHELRSMRWAPRQGTIPTSNADDGVITRSDSFLGERMIHPPTNLPFFEFIVCPVYLRSFIRVRRKGTESLLVPVLSMIQPRRPAFPPSHMAHAEAPSSR